MWGSSKESGFRSGAYSPEGGVPPQKGFTKRPGWHLKCTAWTKSGCLEREAPQVLTRVVPSEGHHFAFWRKSVAPDIVGRNGSLRKKSQHTAEADPAAQHSCPPLRPSQYCYRLLASEPRSCHTLRPTRDVPLCMERPGQVWHHKRVSIPPLQRPSWFSGARPPEPPNSQLVLAM